MATKVGIYRISISPDAKESEFEEFMEREVFPMVHVGRQTRGGIVTAQNLLKPRFSSSDKEYSWVIEWKDQGGSPFGSKGRPPDPAPALEAFGAKTSFSGFAVIAGRH